MQAPVSLICAFCAATFEYPAKEYTRQTVNRGRTADAFCYSQSCTMSLRHRNKEPSIRRSPPNPQYGNNYSRKYSDSDRPYVEVMRRVSNRTGGEHKRVFNIDVEYLKELWIKQGGLCALTGVPIIMGGDRSPFTASLDRVDSSIGYMRGNVQFVAFSVNLAKCSFADEEILEFFRKVVDRANALSYIPSHGCREVASATT